MQSPSKLLVEEYLIETAKNYNVDYELNAQVMAEAQDAMLSRHRSQWKRIKKQFGYGQCWKHASFS